MESDRIYPPSLPLLSPWGCYPAIMAPNLLRGCYSRYATKLQGILGPPTPTTTNTPPSPTTTNMLWGRKTLSQQVTFQNRIPYHRCRHRRTHGWSAGEARRHRHIIPNVRTAHPLRWGIGGDHYWHNVFYANPCEPSSPSPLCWMLGRTANVHPALYSA